MFILLRFYYSLLKF